MGHLSPLLGETQGEVPVGRPHPCGRPVYLDAETLGIKPESGCLSGTATQ
ncbi:hypothetical protein PEC106664_29140 [Pectobacterium carotovorum subsp. carotovorum]|nr:hypothetical protein PEC106664_29140 [Pectobacterium carotovorum subsp. carotovorum]